jgi:hypothetical protein
VAVAGMRKKKSSQSRQRRKCLYVRRRTRLGTLKLMQMSLAKGLRRDCVIVA